MTVKLKLNPNPTFWAPVRIPVPGSEPVEIEVEFRHKGAAQLEQYFDDARKEEATNHAVIKGLVVSWRGVDTEFSDESLSALLEAYPGASIAFIGDYRRGLFEGRRKN